MAYVNPRPQRWALLIGIDFYIPAMGPKSAKFIDFNHLRGCVNDVNLVASFLETRMGLDSNHIVKLTSTNLGTKDQSNPPEDPSLWPTRDNIIKSLEDLGEKSPGDLVYIHFSGHGAQVATAYSNSKGSGALDEVLVPTDVYEGSLGVRFVRDFEVAALLENLVRKHLHVTVVVDSCHSGSANRTTNHDGVRGLGMLDSTDHFPAPAQHETNTFLQAPLNNQVSRKAELRLNWLLEPSGYIFIGACASFQKAREKDMETGPTKQARHGVLTYHLITTLQQQHDLFARSVSELVEVIDVKTRKDYPNQSPFLEGDVEKPFFGVRSGGVARSDSADAHVFCIDAKSKICQLNRGHLHGIRAGDEYDILSSSANSVATVRVIRVNDMGCHVKPITDDDAGIQGVEIGFRAKRVSKWSSLARVGLVLEEEAQWVDEFRRLSEDRGSLYWSLLGDQDDEEKASVYISRTKAGVFELLDQSKTPLPNVPGVFEHDTHWADKILAYLDHVAKFRHIEGLGAKTTASKLRKQCTFQVVGKTDEEPATPDPPQRRDGNCYTQCPYRLDSLTKVEPVGDVIHIKHGEWVLLHFHNTGNSSVYLTVFLFAPDWSIKKLYPRGEGMSEEVKAQESSEHWLPFKMKTPDSCEVTVETIRAIVTKVRTKLDFTQKGVQSCLDPSELRTERKTPVGEAWEVYDVTISTSRPVT